MKTSLQRAALLLLTFAAAVYPAGAQVARFDIRGTIAGSDNLNPKEVNLRLVKAADSSLVKTEIADAQGRFAFENIVEGEYRVIASRLGFRTWRSEVISAAKNAQLTIVMAASRTELKEVTVTAKTPFVTQQFDKTVLNVENSITVAGGTALDVLEKGPGITIDQNDNIKMRGRQGVHVMIDGKRIPMSGAELATYLRGLPANSVEKIDLITNPSAKYDASGNAGMIDIHLKKDKRIGTNGTVSVSNTQGRLNKENAGFSLNRRNKKVNLFGSYNFVFRREFIDLDLERDFDPNGVYSGTDIQSNHFRANYHTHTYRGGVDYSPSPATSIGITLTGLNLNIDRTGTNVSTRLNAAGNGDSRTETTPEAGNNRFNPAANLNVRHKLAKGAELSADLDFAQYRMNDDQYYTTRYFNSAGAPSQPGYLLSADIRGRLNIYSAKTDLSKPLGKAARLEAGLKSSFVKADNDLRFFDESTGTPVADVSKSNHFIYRENINAAFINLSSAKDKWTLQGGLRVENTNTDGRQINGGGTFSRSYVQLFPSAYAGYKVNARHEVGVSVSRRINRPTYNQLNPFFFYINASTYNAGNPYLKPELSYSFELTHTFNQKFITKYGYSLTTDNIVSVLSTDPLQPKVVIQTDRNLARLRNYSISISAPVEIGRAITSTNNLTAYYSMFTGNLVNTALRSGKPAFNMNSSNAITLNTALTAEIVGVYQSSEVYAFMHNRANGTLAVGLQQQIWKRRGSIKLSAADLLYTGNYKAVVRNNGYREQFVQRRDSRTVTVNFTYRFGNNSGQARKANGGAEEEKRRAG